MDSLKTTKLNEGRKNRYLTNFNSEGKLEKIVEYLKTKTTNTSGIKVIDVKIESEGNIKRIMTCPLPNTTAVNTVIGNKQVNVIYDIAYNDSMIIIKSVNPDEISKFFKFTDILSIVEDSGKLLFSRDAVIYNAGMQIPVFGSSYQEYDDYFNHSNLCFYLELSSISV
jgi:hypothetical protein